MRKPCSGKISKTKMKESDYDKLSIDYLMQTTTPKTA